MRALLGKGSVVDHQHGIAAADEPIRLNKQFCLHRRCLPDPGGNEVVQLIIFAEHKPLRHRLNALAIARCSMQWKRRRSTNPAWTGCIGTMSARIGIRLSARTMVWSAYHRSDTTNKDAPAGKRRAT